jgi:hypothetical protein
MPIEIIIMGDGKDRSGIHRVVPIVGARPIVVFTSKSGRVVRVRGARSDAGGQSPAVVRLPDAGPWSSTMRVPGRKLAEGGGDMGTFFVGPTPNAIDPARKHVVRPPADKPARASSSGIAFGWILLGGAALLAALGFTATRTGLPGRLRTRLGGGA